MKFYTTVGGSDEKLHIYYAEIVKSAEEIKEIENKLHGVAEEGENIRVKMVDFSVQEILNLSSA